MTISAAPAAFHFSVHMDASGSSGETTVQFAEVFGLDKDISVEPITEGGENRFVHQLPKVAQHQNLVLNRAIVKADNALMKWVNETLNNDFTSAIETRRLTVTLLDTDNQPIMAWVADRCYPVKFESGAFDAMSNEVAIQQVEFSCSDIKRLS